MMIRNGRWLSALAFGALLTSCSGGASPGSGTALTPAMPVQPVAKATTAPSPGAASPTTGATTSSFPAGTTAVSLTVAIPQRTASAHSRKPLGTASTITGIQALVTINSLTYPAYAGTCGATTCSVTFPISLQYNTGLEVDLLAGYNAVQASVTTIPVSSLTEGTNNPITLPPFKAIVGAIEVQSTVAALYSSGIPQTVPLSVTLLDPNGGDVYGNDVLDGNRQPLTSFTLTSTSGTTIGGSATLTQQIGQNGAYPVSDFSYTASYGGVSTVTQSIVPSVPGGNFVSSLPALLGYVTPAMITLTASGGLSGSLVNLNFNGSTTNGTDALSLEVASPPGQTPISGTIDIISNYGSTGFTVTSDTCTSFIDDSAFRSSVGGTVTSGSLNANMNIDASSSGSCAITIEDATGLTAGPSATISIYVNQYYFTVEGKQRAR